MKYRYQRDPRNMSVGSTQRGGSRLQGVVIVLLAAALIVTLVLTLPSAGLRAEERRLIAGRMLTECDTAASQVSQLSRTGSSSSNVTLMQIRSEIYAIDTMNQIHMGLNNGNSLLDSALISAVYTTIDTYANQLNKGGSTTGDLQTELTARIDALRAAVLAVND